MNIRLTQVRFEIYFDGENESFNAEFVLNDTAAKGMSFSIKSYKIMFSDMSVCDTFST